MGFSSDEPVREGSDCRSVVRLACVNADNTPEDLDSFFGHVREVAG